MATAVRITLSASRDRLRLFVPTAASGPGVLAQMMERHPLVRIADKAAA
jgi:hypothetical protein